MLGAGGWPCEAMVGYSYQLDEPLPARNERAVYDDDQGAEYISVWKERWFVMHAKFRYACINGAS